MTAFPIIPPDPDPEEVAQGLRLAATLGDLLDVFAAAPLEPEQRKALNDASRHMQRAVDLWTDVEDQQAGRSPRKPQRGKIPKRGARTRKPGRPRASVEDVAGLARRVERSAPPAQAPGEREPEPVDE